MKRKLITVALFGAILSPFSAHADDAMEIMVVTPTRMSQSTENTIADTTVLSAEDIRNSQAPDVPALLKSVAGIEIAQAGGIGQQSSLFMRGTNSDHVLVLMDGVRIENANFGTTALDQLMLDQIDHIEVVRGNASSLYGSSAIGGVVQIFTKHGKGQPAFNASIGAGSHNTQRAAAGFGGQSDGTDFNVQVSKFKTDGVSAINPNIFPNANPDKDGYDNNSLSASVRHSFNMDHSLSASVFQSRGYIQFDNAFGVPTDVNTSVDTLSKLSLSSDNRLTEMWQSKLQWSEGTDDLKTYLNGLPDPAGNFVKTINRQLTWQNDLTLDTHNSALLGAENLKQHLDSDTLYSQTERISNSMFGGYTGNFGAHQIQTNLRQDHYSDFGVANTGLLGYGYKLTESWRTTASYSTAFKAPTFNDLYYPSFFGYQGNPNLQPERSHNTEVGVHYSEGVQHVDLVYFNNDINNLIAINSAGTTVVNINRARINGAELNYAGQFGDTGVRAALTAQNPRDATAGVQLDRRSRQHSSLAVTQQLSAWQVGGEWLYSGTRPDAGNTRTLAAYNVFNLTAGYALSKELKLLIRADNLTNQNDSNIYGYNSLGRRLFASVNYQH